MVSDPKLQAAYHIFNVAQFPWQSPEWYEAKAEAEAWARLATVEELGLSSEDWQLFSNGTKPRKERGA